MYFWLTLHFTVHKSAASPESSRSPSSVPASHSSSSSYNADCSSWLLFSTFNFNHFPPLLFQSPEQASVLNSRFSWLCGQTWWALTLLSQWHAHVPCGPDCSTCSAILEEEDDAVCWSAFLWTHSPLRVTTCWITLLVSSSLAPQQLEVQDQHSHHHLFSH